jgi:5-methyltetrahydrofolate--homocysteine methyltransferase
MNWTRQQRQQALEEALQKRILILDGAMGTMLQQLNPTIEDWGGPVFENCPENLLFTRPDWIRDIHRQYYQAGADIVETDSFGGHTVTLAEFGLEARIHEVNALSARIAREAAAEFEAKDGRPRFVAGSMGPTTKAITVTGGITFDSLRDGYYKQAKGLIDGGADILLVETAQDTRNIKAALLGINQLGRELGYTIPTMISGTIENTGTMLAGQDAEAFYSSLAHSSILSIGLNCATGPEFMTDHIRSLHEMSHHHISCYPNAGVPNEELKYNETPASLAAQIEKFLQQGWLNIVGGCCGTTPDHIHAISEIARHYQPRAPRRTTHRAYYSGIELVEADETNRPLLVGERTNVIGSRLFKNMINEEKWEEATEIARRQVRTGAHIIDVCLQTSERDELKDIPPFYEKLIRKIKAPLMIDTTDPKAVELALSYSQGKAIINSINLEDGEEKFEHICPLIRDYGAAIVVGTIDEDPVQAQAFTRERKLAIARRSTTLLTEKYGLAPEDIIIDPLVFPCATGDENYIGGAVETIEALRLIKSEIPYVKTVLGISNISFGLPAAAREVVNSVFLYHCTKAGLDLAIVNTEKLERFASIPAEERQLAENLLFNSPIHGEPADWRLQSKDQKAALNKHHIDAIAAHFRTATKKVKVVAAELPLDQRLANYIIQGTKDGLIDDLNLKLAEGAAPLDVINGPLMNGMDEVGRLFNNNELIVAEVLQSAEAMKAGVGHLQQFMEKSETTSKGKLLLATVKGDVHDIGKNLVEIILSNNGFEVVNLGIKVPPEELIKGFHQHQPDAIGLSGLLVKSAQQMVITGSDLKDAGIDVPLLVGGAALSDKYTRTKIAPAYGSLTLYAKDAMTGLKLMQELADPAARKALETADFSKPTDAVAAEPMGAPALALSTTRSTKVRLDLPIAPVPYWDRKVRAVPQLKEIWDYINPFMLYGKNLGYKGNFEANLAARESKALEMFHKVEEVKAWAADFLKPKAVWQFFETERDGNSIHLFHHCASTPVHTYHFLRQPKENGLCLSDYVLPPVGGQRDAICLFAVTAGSEFRARAEQAKHQGEYFKSVALLALATETAEATAEWLHRRIREDWGFADSPDMTMQQRWTSRYRGKRYSFGYGACPNMEDQVALFQLINPGEIGIELTEGFMMEPEASVSALVFHHPDAAYFTAASAEDLPEA